MRPRTRLFVVFAVFGVGLFVLGTGAFTTVSAERTVSVNTAADDAALLELTPNDGPNGKYADGSGDELEINFDAVPATGVNQNAITTLRDVFNVTNRGTQTASVYITKSGANAGLVNFENGTGSQIDGGSTNGVSVPVGESVEVAIVVDTTGQNLSGGDTLLDSITIHAEA